MKVICMILLIVLSLWLIILVTLQPRQSQIFSNDATSNIRKPSYWSSQFFIKLSTLGVSIVILIVLIALLIISYGN